MKNHTRFFGLALVGVVALLLPLKADAACGNISFGGYYAHVTNTTNGPSLRSNFWMLNFGNPNFGAGADNGAIAETGKWLIPYSGGIGILSNWGVESYDGCADDAGAVSGQRMVFSFSDVDGGGNPTYAVICVHRDTTAGQQFNLDLPPGCGSGACGDFALVPSLKAAFANTTRAGQESNVTVASPVFNGFYSDGTCTAAQAIPQYDVYKQQVGRGILPTSSRDANAWTFVGTGTTGSGFSFTTNCTTAPPNGNCDVYVATAPHFNSGFTSAEAASAVSNPSANVVRVGANSTVLQAGPILAETPKVKVIKNDKTGTRK
jgi:hypothetical protein